MHYSLKTPCKNCPFRTDIKPFLRPARARDIAISLEQAEFPCHKTLNYSQQEGQGVETRHTSHCAGALIMLEKMEQLSQMMRISERLGLYDHQQLNMTAPVFDSAEEFIQAQKATG